MISFKRLNLFPIIFQYKKYGMTFVRIGSCCDLTFYELKALLLLKFIFKDKIYYQCPKCRKIHAVDLRYHIVPYYDKELKDLNKRLKNSGA